MTDSTEITTFIEAYMVLKLADSGVDRPDLLGFQFHSAEVCPSHRTLTGSEMAESKVQTILANLDLLDTLKNLHISKNTLLRTFLYITDTLFVDDAVSWWKLVTLVDCSAQMAVMCVDRELPNMVENLLAWTSMFMETGNVKSWIEDNGGWSILGVTSTENSQVTDPVITTCIQFGTGPGLFNKECLTNRMEKSLDRQEDDSDGWSNEDSDSD